MIIVICGWCHAFMGDKPGPAGMVSHGLCKSCEAKLNAELDAEDAQRVA